MRQRVEQPQAAIASGPGRGEVDRRDELEARRKDGLPGRTRYADEVLERLAEGLERRPLKLGKLVEQQDAVVSQGAEMSPEALLSRRR